MGLLDKFRRNTTSYENAAEKKAGSLAETARYRGVEVVANSDTCCQAANAIEGQRFLLSQVPMLPLAECDAADCRCTYERFDDRRMDVRRAPNVAFDLASQFQEQENRLESAPGRRDDD